MWFTSAAMLAVGQTSGLFANGAGSNPLRDSSAPRTGARTAAGIASQSPATVAAEASSNRQVLAYRKAAQRLAPASGGTATSSEAQQIIARLKAADAAVRAHEAAHIAAGGSLVRGAASYTYTKGPDGVMYATGGEVSIDIAPVAGDPKATIEKMETVRAAALAPSDPSAADHAAAAAAAQVEALARGELAQGEGREGSDQVSGRDVEAAYSPLRPEPVPLLEAVA